jgi:hypothetical protein
MGLASASTARHAERPSFFVPHRSPSVKLERTRERRRVFSLKGGRVYARVQCTGPNCKPLNDAIALSRPLLLVASGRTSSGCKPRNPTDVTGRSLSELLSLTRSRNEGIAPPLSHRRRLSISHWRIRQSFVLELIQACEILLRVARMQSS